MAWHILHLLLEQARGQSTFPGKLWILFMFVFRMLVVSRIGEDVYHDEQSSFICNTLTPGCTNVCFNRFSPISQLRFWSLMVIVVATPTILFFLYAMHEIFHADIKFPYKEEKKNNLNISSKKRAFDTVHLPKRKKGSLSDVRSSSQTPLFVVTKMTKSPKSGRRLGKFLRKRRHESAEDDVFLKRSVSDNNAYDVLHDRRNFRMQSQMQSRHQQVSKRKNACTAEEREMMEERKFRNRMLQHPELARAYWWHVVIRTVAEVSFLLGQYYLYGFRVNELYECAYWPCPKSVDCFVSRPQEKTCFLWLMYGLGALACLLSIAEFWTLGFMKMVNAFICCSDESYVDRKKRLAMLEVQPHKMKRAVSMDSVSSDSTVESV